MIPDRTVRDVPGPLFPRGKGGPGRMRGAICRWTVPCRIAFRIAALRQAGGDDNQEKRSPGAGLLSADAWRGGSARLGLGADESADTGANACAKPCACP